MQEDGILVLADSYYPGWEVYVDGQKTSILPANINQRAIILSKGEHSVKFVFQPISFKLGAIISIFSTITLFMLFIFSILKSKVFKKF